MAQIGNLGYVVLGKLADDELGFTGLGKDVPNPDGDTFVPYGSVSEATDDNAAILPEAVAYVCALVPLYVLADGTGVKPNHLTAVGEIVLTDEQKAGAQREGDENG